MKKFDFKHIAFHALLGLYFIWLIVFGTLLVLAVNNIINNGSPEIAKLLLIWISLNFIMGICLFIVLRLFRNRTILGRIILYTFTGIAIAALVIVITLMSGS